MKKEAVSDSPLVYTDYTKEWLFHGIAETSPESSDQELWLLPLCIRVLALTINTEALQVLFSPYTDEIQGRWIISGLSPGPEKGKSH